jgi:hypothetical protein
MSATSLAENLIISTFGEDVCDLKWAEGSPFGGDKQPHHKGLLVTIRTEHRGEVHLLLYAPYNYVGVYFYWDQEDPDKRYFPDCDCPWHIMVYHDSCWREGIHDMLWNLDLEHEIQGLGMWGLKVVELDEEVRKHLHNETQGDWGRDRITDKDYIYGRKFHRDRCKGCYEFEDECTCGKCCDCGKDLDKCDCEGGPQ